MNARQIVRDYVVTTYHPDKMFRVGIIWSCEAAHMYMLKTSLDDRVYLLTITQNKYTLKVYDMEVLLCKDLESH